MYREFARDIAAFALPTVLLLGYPLAYLGLVVSEALSFSLFALISGTLVSIGLGQVLLTLYKYPRHGAEETTVLEALADPYASPVRGKPVGLDGALIGRGQAGYRFSEDLMFQDKTGLLYLKYESWLPVLGDFLFALRQVPELIGQDVEVDGWFLRGTSPWVGMRRLRPQADGDEAEEIEGFIHYGSLVSGGLLVGAGLVVAALGVVF